MSHHRCPERGQALPLLTLVLVLGALSALVVVEVAVAALERQRAQLAADAGALAGAAGDTDDARALVEANGGHLVAANRAGGEVEVRVRLGRAGATATATGGRTAPSGTGPRQELAPVLQAALARLDDLLGFTVPLTVGSAHGPGGAAHASGLAADVAPEVLAMVLPVVAQAGLCHPMPEDHPVHFEPCPPTPP